MDRPMVAVQDVPRAPRSVFRRNLWHQAPGIWICGLVFTILALVSGLTLLIIQWIARPGFFLADIQLDRASIIAEGRVTGLKLSSSGRSRSGDTYRVDFTFSLPDGSTIQGYSFLKRPDLQTGDPVTVEHLADDPTLARIVGTYAAAVPTPLLWLPISMGSVGLFFLMLIRLRSQALRRLLSDGDACLAKVTDISLNRRLRVNGMHPWRFTYRFHAGASGASEGQTQWFPADRKTTQPPISVGDQVVILFQRNHPDNNTIVWASDFDAAHE